MKEFKITVVIKIDVDQWDTFVWQTSCEDFAAAMKRAQRFAELALEESCGQLIMSISILDNSLEAMV